MRLIVGGAYQGKRAYVMQNYGIREDEITDGASIDAGSKDITDIFKCISNFHILIRNILEAGKDPMEVTGRILAKNPNVVILMDEVGNGIIPMEYAERIWREQVGKCGCFLATQAESVERIVCGIATRIK